MSAVAKTKAADFCRCFYGMGGRCSHCDPSLKTEDVMEKLKHGDTFQGRVLVNDINLTFIHPPIPDRNMDWQATRSGYDQGDPIGRGQNPIIALADLLEQELELA